jgi:TolB protein
VHWLLGACVAVTLAACARLESATATPTVVQATLTPTSTPTATPTVTPTAPPTPTSMPTVTPMPTPTATPTPTSVPTPLGGGGLIAFSAYIDGNWDIYAVRPADAASVDGRSVRLIRLTSHPAEDRFPAFSPDGRTLAFASRRDGHWNLYALTPDGAIVQLTDDPAYDGAPAWSPDGQRLAFESARAGNLDVWAMDAQAGAAPVNLTGDSASGELGPIWSPDGMQIAFTSWRYEDADLFALDLETGQVRQLTSSPAEEHLFDWSAADAASAGGELLYVVNEGERQDAYSRPAGLSPEETGTRLTRWRWIDAPARSPDADAASGTVLAYLYRRPHGVQLFLQRSEVPGDLPSRLTGDMALAGPLSWTGVVAPWREAQGEPVNLYVEGTEPGDDAPYDLQRLEGVTVGNPWLSDRVDDSFRAMRRRIVDETGHDFLARLSDAWRAVSYDSDGSSYTSWHKAGRAIDTLLDYLSPDRRQRWLEVAIEPAAGDVYWRLYLRCERQDGSQGMPLRVRPWDVTADARANLRGGRFKPAPEGYYVDLTALMAEYGWLRIAAHDRPDFDWHTNFVALEYWHFQKTDGLSWYEAMLELFPRSVVELHHSWEVQQLKGTPLWLAWAKGVPLPWKERRMLERIAR